MRADGLAAALDGERGGDGQPDDAGHVERAGADLALLTAAVQQRHAGDVAAQQQRARAGRAAELVAGHGERVDARTRRSRPATVPTACTASVCIGTSYSWAIAASSAIGWTVPTSLLAHMTRDQGDRVGVVVDAPRAERPGATGP